MGKKRKRDGFQVVPVGYSLAAREQQQQRGEKGTNTLQNARSGAMKKKDEMWFRKCGHGERLFTEYYRAEGSPIPPQSWDAFMASFKTKLPITWRFRAGAAADERADLESRLIALGLAAPVPWASADEGIWQAWADKKPSQTSMSSAKGGGGKGGGGSGKGGKGGKGGGGGGKGGDGSGKGGDSSGGKGAALAAMLADGVSRGLLNRQECVSMLPVYALQVPAGGYVLDTCSSPGQKTIQLLEAVCGEGGGEGGHGDAGDERGMVIANDAHPNRVHALIEAIGRHSRPQNEMRRLVVACHRGEAFPAPVRPFRKAGGAARADGAATEASADDEETSGFDRVLTDVPCSGDGTIRKDPTVLPRWTPGVGTLLHAVQLEIAWRGLELLRVGGRMVYSTCSLNPIEDEAVVAALIARADAICPGAVTIDKWPASVLPQLKRRAGLHTWRVADHVEAARAPIRGGVVEEEDSDDDEEEWKLRWHADHAAAIKAKMEGAVPTLWPPPGAEKMHLERCSRMLPHDQDTGGFFVALLRKHKPIGRDHLARMMQASASKERAKKSASASRELPPLPDEEKLLPLPAAQASELGASLGVRAPRRRLLRSTRDHATVHLAPKALAAFAPGELCVAKAGVVCEPSGNS